MSGTFFCIFKKSENGELLVGKYSDNPEYFHVKHPAYIKIVLIKVENFDKVYNEFRKQLGALGIIISKETAGTTIKGLPQNKLVEFVHTFISQFYKSGYYFINDPMDI